MGRVKPASFSESLSGFTYIAIVAGLDVGVWVTCGNAASVVLDKTILVGVVSSGDDAPHAASTLATSMMTIPKAIAVDLRQFLFSFFISSINSTTHQK
jgi:hypothetical protein